MTKAKINFEQRAKLLCLNPYQRDQRYVGKGRHHWAMATAKVDGATWAEWIIAVFKRGQAGPQPGMFSAEALSKVLSEPRGNPVEALVNHNRWVAFCECGGCEVVDPEQRYFFCFSCMNFLTDGYPRKVHFPRNWDHIEQRLLVRDDPLTRSWLPTETVENLEAENVAHRLPAKQVRSK